MYHPILQNLLPFPPNKWIRLTFFWKAIFSRHWYPKKTNKHVSRSTFWCIFWGVWLPGRQFFYQDYEAWTNLYLAILKLGVLGENHIAVQHTPLKFNIESPQISPYFERKEVPFFQNSSLSVSMLSFDNPLYRLIPRTSPLQIWCLLFCLMLFFRVTHQELIKPFAGLKPQLLPSNL